MNCLINLALCTVDCMVCGVQRNLKAAEDNARSAFARGVVLVPYLHVSDDAMRA
jgi:hypothetical protein